MSDNLTPTQPKNFYQFLFDLSDGTDPIIIIKIILVIKKSYFSIFLFKFSININL